MSVQVIEVDLVDDIAEEEQSKARPVPKWLNYTTLAVVTAGSFLTGAGVVSLTQETPKVPPPVTRQIEVGFGNNKTVATYPVGSHIVVISNAAKGQETGCYINASNGDEVAQLGIIGGAATCDYTVR